MKHSAKANGSSKYGAQRTISWLGCIRSFRTIRLPNPSRAPRDDAGLLQAARRRERPATFCFLAPSQALWASSRASSHSLLPRRTITGRVAYVFPFSIWRTASETLRAPPEAGNRQ